MQTGSFGKTVFSERMPHSQVLVKKKETKTLEPSFLIQFVGWLASITAICSYSLNDMCHIRMVNCGAALLFILYGAFILAPAIIIMNASLASIHIAYLVGKERFSTFVESRRKLVWSAFSIYAVASFLWVAVSTNADPAELVGIASSIGFVGGFLMSKERPMRYVCSLALVTNIVYAIMISSPQIALTSTVSLTVNIYHLVKGSRRLPKKTYEDEPPAN